MAILASPEVRQGSARSGSGREKKSKRVFMQANSFFSSRTRAAIRSFKLDRPEAVLEERRVRRTYNQLMFTDRYDDPLDRGCPVAGKSAAARNGSSESLAGSSDADVDAEADADITYTFDHATGPTGGDQILGDALAKAVERFETTQTERLVNKEYEVLDSEGEAVRRVQRGSGGGSGANAARRRQRRARRREDVLSDAGNEDGYEFV